jgi:hypothetical protein
MKKLNICVITGMLLLTTLPIQLRAATDPVATPIAAEAAPESARAAKLLNRLKEIDAADKSGMNASEKKHMRKEVRAIKKELKELGGGVYLSVGAVIIIILLLILLL